MDLPTRAPAMPRLQSVQLLPRDRYTDPYASDPNNASGRHHHPYGLAPPPAHTSTSSRESLSVAAEGDEEVMAIPKSRACLLRAYPQTPLGKVEFEYNPQYSTHEERSVIMHGYRRPKTKEQIRDSHVTDSSLQQGYFLDRTRQRGVSFSRAKRFSHTQGWMAGTALQDHWLSSEMEQLQRQVKMDRQRRQNSCSGSVSVRGRFGENVNGHWNTPKGGIAPGPGAYTPKYATLSGSKGMGFFPRGE